MDYQHIFSLNENSSNFLKKHTGLLKKAYPASHYYKNIRISLDDLIDEKENLTSLPKLLFTKEGLTHFKLLLSISSGKEIKSFYQKVKDKNIIDPHDPDHNDVKEILDKFHENSKTKKDTRVPKFDLESLKYLKEMMTNSKKKDYEQLLSSKEELRYYKEKIYTSTILYKNKLKEKFIAEREVIKSKEKNMLLDALKKSLQARKSKLRFIRKRINLHSKHFKYEQKEKIGNAKYELNFSVEGIVKEKNKYNRMLTVFREQKMELEKIQREMQNISNRGNGTYIKYSEVCKELSLIEHDLKRDTTYKDDLTKEIKSLIGRIRKYQSELKSLKKIIASSDSFENRYRKKAALLICSLNAQKKVFDRFKNSKNHSIDFCEIAPLANDVEKNNLEIGELSKSLDIFHQGTQKILTGAVKLVSNLTQGREVFEKIKKEITSSIPIARIMKFKKEIAKNKNLLSNLIANFDGLEKNFINAKKEEEAKLSSLRELKKKHGLLISKQQIFIELSKEKILSDESLLTGLYEKLVCMKIQLSTNYQILESSCIHNTENLKTLYDAYSEIEGQQKDIRRKIQYGREFLEKEENSLNMQINQQGIIFKKHNEFYGKFHNLNIEREDIEILIYQNSDLEKQLNYFCPSKTKKYELGGLAFESFYHTGYFKNGYIQNRLNKITNLTNLKFFRKESKENIKAQNDEIISQEEKPDSASNNRFLNFNSPTLPLTGILIFLTLSGFAYLFAYKSSAIYDYKNSSLIFNNSSTTNNEKEILYNENISNIFSYQRTEKTKLFGENNLMAFFPIVKTNSPQNNALNIIPFALLPESRQINITEADSEAVGINALWSNYVDIFDDLRFDNPSNVLLLLELMMNKQVLDLTLMDSIQLLYSLKNILQSEEGPFFDRLFQDFVKLGNTKKEAASNLLHNNRLIEKNYDRSIHFIFKGKIRPITTLEEMTLRDFEKIIIPYIVINYKSLVMNKTISTKKNISSYAKKLAQDIYICAKKFRVPVTSLLAIAHQEYFFIAPIADSSKSNSFFQISQPTKIHILDRMRKDGFKIPKNISNTESHITLVTFMTAYHFAHLMRHHARPIIDPLTHKPVTLILNLGKSTYSYSGGKKYGKNVLLKQIKLESYLNDKIKRIAVS